MQQQYPLHPSHYLATMLIAAHGATIMALFPLTFPLWAKIALTLLVLFNLGYRLRREAWLTAPSSTVMIILKADQVVLTRFDGKNLAGQILRDSLVTPYLTVLNVLLQGSRFPRSVVILSDSMDQESFRKLRVWLKWSNSKI